MPAKADCPKGKTQLSVLVSTRPLNALRRLVRDQGQSMGFVIDQLIRREVEARQGHPAPADEEER